MPAKVPDIIKYFRGRRIAIPLAAVGIIVFIVLGGHQKILSFAVNQMAGFLLGAGDLVEQELAEDSNLVTENSSKENLFSGSAIISQIAPTRAVAGEADPPAEGAGEMKSPVDEPADTMVPDTAVAEPDAEEGADYGRKVVTAYTAAFLRDPFYSLIATGREKPTKLLEVSGARMVGSVWGESGIIALLEDDGGRSYALRVGDRVQNGSVVSVTPASITFSITVFGLTKSVTLELAEEGEW